MSPSTDQASASSGQSFASLFESSIAATEELKEYEVAKGTVVKVNKDSVVVDIGYKSEGVIPIAEFSQPGGEVTVQRGDVIDVFIESKESDDGLVVLSKEKADRLKVWDEISEACERDELIEGTITARVKGGLSVTIRGGVKAFLPGSQVDLRPTRNLDKLISQTFRFKVIKFNKKRGNIVLSRRALLERERDELKQQTLQDLSEGMVVEGIIKNIKEYGAFVDLGGIDGLLHITDMSWGRINHPSEKFQVGDRVTVKVLKYDTDVKPERVSLGLKQLMEDPWNHALESYPIGKRVTGKVVSLTDYGAFVEIEQGVEGLIHVSEMSWGKPKHPSKMLEVGSEVECQVLEVDATNKRISLGIKQLEPDPWSGFVSKYNPGDIIRGKVRSITDYGIFVGIEDGVDGMVHRSDLSWSPRSANPGEVYQKGDEVEAIILSVNHDEKKVSLGIKQLYEDPWQQVDEKYPVGTNLEVRVLAFEPEGAHVALERGVEGFIHVSELRDEATDKPEDAVNVGDIVQGKVVDVNGNARRISLTLRDVDPSQAKKFQPVQDNVPSTKPTGPSGRSGATLGDVLKDQLGELAKND